MTPVSKPILTTIVGVLAVAVAYLYFDRPHKMAYVESNKILVNYKGMQDASKDYQQKLSLWTANIDTLKSELNMEIKKFNEDKAGMTKKELELNQKLIATKQQQLLDYRQSVEEKARQEDQIMTEKVLEKVNTFIKHYGEMNDFDIIMAATEAGNLVFAKDKLNITDKILEGLNNEYDGQK